MSLPLPAFSPVNVTLYSNTLQYNRSVKSVSTTSSTSTHLTVLSFSNEKADTTKFVCAGPRPVGATKIFKWDDKSRKLQGMVADKSTLQDYRVDEHVPEEKRTTFIRDNKAGVTVVGDRRYNIDLQSKVTSPEMTPKWDNWKDTAEHNVYLHVRIHKGNIMSSCEGSEKTLKRGHGGHLTTVGEDDQTPPGDGKNTFHRGKDAHSTTTRGHKYIVRAPPVRQVFAVYSKGRP